ncbi:Aspartic peptidase A1 [Mycena kentingensis (nom. inval.)]|nr:Aspartic peptidase A1 [Mycena kentingensis (nom. inval.)]
MRSLVPLSLFLTILDFLPSSYAAIPFEVVTYGPDSSLPPHLAKRGVGISNNGNAAYMANMSLGGVSVAVILDTGSSDLWVKFPGTPPASKDTGKSLSLNYAVGSASGSIRTVELQFDNFTIPDQAFCASSSHRAPSAHLPQYKSPIQAPFPPTPLSMVSLVLDPATVPLFSTSSTRPPATRYSTASSKPTKRPKTTSPSSSTGRTAAPRARPLASSPSPSPQRASKNITSQAKLDVTTVFKLLDDQQHWQTLTDKDSVVGPDGTVINIDSAVSKAPDRQLVAVFDSGFTFSQVPRELSDAIYGRVQGAVYDEKNEWWTVPCQQELNLTFHFGGVAFPMHPLDVVDDNFKITDKNGNHVCIGAFQPITSAFSVFGNFDMIMGMTFHRNAYTLMDFGDWADDTDDQGDPYMQLLPLTDRNSAHADFVKVRLNGVDSTGDAQYALLPTSQQQHSPISEEEKKKNYERMILSRLPYIITGVLAAVALLVGYIVWRCCCRRKRQGKKGFGFGKEKVPATTRARPGDDGFAEQKSETYLPLQVHSPQPGTPGASGSRSSLGQAQNPFGHDSQASLSPPQQHAQYQQSEANFQQQPHQQYPSSQYSEQYGGGGYQHQQEYQHQQHDQHQQFEQHQQYDYGQQHQQYDYGQQQQQQYYQQQQYHAYAQQQYPQQGQAYGYAN